MNIALLFFQRILLFPLMTLSLLSAWSFTPALAAQESPRRQAAVLHVSPTGDDQADGSQEMPLATVRQALERLPSPEGGSIVLAGGIYTESFTVDGSGGPVVITAAPEQKVIFEGGQKLPSWKPHPERARVFIAQIEDRQSLYGNTDYLDLWDQDERVRYGKVADAAGVEHWPGSIVMEGDRVLFHPHRGQTPEGLNLWVNRSADGVTIKRDNVTLQRLHFRNYLGGQYARALSVLNCRKVTIRECTFTNCTKAITSTSDNLTVLDSGFRDVGTGVTQTRIGKELTVRGCVFEGAIGAFAFSDVHEHVRNGIRIYHEADGAVIEECVTSGFWAGLYIKTASAKPGSRPYTIRNNTFLDGVRSGFDHHHPRTTLANNIIGTPSSMEAAGRKASYYAEMGATLSHNLFVGEDAPETHDPFVNLTGGDLTLRPGHDPTMGATTLRKVSWSDRTARHLTPRAPLVQPATLVGEPVVTASRLGALISATFSQPVEATLTYRVQGSAQWLSATGGDNTIRLPRNMIAAIPFEPGEPDAYPWIFALMDHALLPGKTYEFRLSATDSRGGVLPAVTGTFTTVGEPKRLHVAAGADPAKADGSERHPFAQLQPALDRALPGDTVFLAPGLYSRPAILRHGGTETARLTLEGAGWEKTILDGGKRVGTLLELQSASHVTVRGVQIRWFGNRGISVHDSPGFHLEASWIWNQGFSGTGICGIGVWLEKTPDSVLSHNLFNRLQNAVMAHSSPGLTFTHNTAFGNLYSGLDLRYSARNSVVTHNSLTFTGNRSLFICEDDRGAFDSLVCDYNNYASKVRKAAPKRPENDFEPADRYGILTGQSKGIIAVTMGEDVWRDFHTMADWRTFSAKDAHSLFADPQYVDPLHKDLRLLPDSPNLLADGGVIGALPVLPARGSALPEHQHASHEKTKPIQPARQEWLEAIRRKLFE